MNCAESEQFFDAYLDRELSGSLRLEFDAHRLRCPVCQQKLAMMEVCEHILARDDRIPALSDDFTDGVMNQVNQRRLVSQRSRRRRIVIGATVALQAAAVLVFAVIWSGGWKPTGEPVVRNEPLVIKAGVLIDERNAFQLGELIYDELERAFAARLIPNEAELRDAAMRYAASMLVPGGLTSPSDAATWSPLGTLGIPASTGAEEAEPAPGAAGSFSL